ncbi:MAG TPA: hypothetical protein VM532_02230, partial [Burkholderiales bacterium]|nr:hypothetical protein [Burkholderiales bacterium]
SKFKSAASAVGKGIGKGASWAWKKKYEILGWAAVGCAVAGLAVLTAGVGVAVAGGLVGTVAGLSGAGAVAGTAAAVSSVAGIVAGAGAVSILAAGGLAVTMGAMKTVGFVAKPFIWAGKGTINLFRSKKKPLDDDEKSLLEKDQEISQGGGKKRKRDKSEPENSVELNQNQVNIPQPLSSQMLNKYHQEGNKFFDKENPNKELFEYADENKDKVVIKSLSPDLVADILKDLKTQKDPNDQGEVTLTIGGSPEFIALAVEEANKLGIKLKGQTDEASKAIEALQAKQPEMIQVPPPPDLTPPLQPSRSQSPRPPSYTSLAPPNLLDNPFDDPIPPPQSHTKAVPGQNGKLVSPTTHWLDAYTPTAKGEELEIKHQDTTYTFLGKSNGRGNTEYVALTTHLDPALQSAGTGAKVSIVKNDLGTNTVQPAGKQPAIDEGKGLNRSGSFSR